ncbi:MAG: hypothetical protein ACKO14_04530, partial [Armatimonadota bacterium]
MLQICALTMLDAKQGTTYLLLASVMHLFHTKWKLIQRVFNCSASILALVASRSALDVLDFGNFQKSTVNLV